jgi:acetyltransferase-like isoleucine patch superfamily enzyme/acyl carrier protein
VSALTAFLLKQRQRWHRRGIDPAHHLRRHLAYYVAEHGFEIGDFSIGQPTIHLYNISKLTVGKYSSIAANSHFIMGGHHRTDTVSTSFFEARRGRGPPVADIVVGSDVWIANNATIVSGATIGDGAAVGPGSVVISDVPAYGVVFGNPARLMRMRFPPDVVEELLRLRWWDLPRAQVLPLRELLMGDDVMLAINEIRKLKGLPHWHRDSVQPLMSIPSAMEKLGGSGSPRSEEEIQRWCIDYLADALEIAPSAVEPNARFARLGIDSATSITFAVDLEEWLGVEIKPEVIFEQPTIAALARHLAGDSAVHSTQRHID